MFCRGDKGRSTCLCASVNEEEKNRVEPERYSTQLEKQIYRLTLEKSNIEEELKVEREAHLEAVYTTAN